jgi:hypothetical protein
MAVLVFPLIAALSTPAIPVGDDQGGSTIIFGVS